MPTDVVRSKPFQAQNLWPGRGAAYGAFDRPDSVPEPLGKGVSLLRAPRDLSYPPYVVPYVRKRPRRKRKHLRALGKTSEGRRQVVGRSGANVAEILRNDEVRRKGCQ